VFDCFFKGDPGHQQFQTALGDNKLYRTSCSAWATPLCSPRDIKNNWQNEVDIHVQAPTRLPCLWLHRDVSELSSFQVAK